MSADPVTIGLMLAATAGSYMQQQQVQKRQSKLADAMSSYEGQKAAETREAAEGYIKDFEPEAQVSQRNDAIGKLEGSMAESIKAAQSAETPQNIAGRVSSRYTDRVAANDADINAKMKRLTQQLSVIGAPGQLAFDDARRFSRAASKVDASNSAARNVGGVYRGLIGQVSPDPLLGIGSQLAAGYAIARGGRKAA